MCLLCILSNLQAKVAHESATRSFASAEECAYSHPQPAKGD
jgi:hypothetical protein